MTFKVSRPERLINYIQVSLRMSFCDDDDDDGVLRDVHTVSNRMLLKKKKKLSFE